jgi:5-deoxy-5-amino-3-dehydroquinate synthase
MSQAVEPRIVTVDLGDRAYPIVVGQGLVDSIASWLPNDATRALVVTQSGVPFDGIVAAVRASGRTVEVCCLPSGESAKQLETVGEVCSAASTGGLRRNDVIISVGGGVVSDVAGFAASVYLRGIRVVHVPTTLLAQVDAAIGGKTGVNTAAGKNLIGTFYQPFAVLCDVSLLDSLDADELRSGRGELAKYAFLDPDGLAVFGKYSSVDTASLVQLVSFAATIKARFVESDELERATSATLPRVLLNYGHTLAHAIESATRFSVRHGDAVALGLRFAALLALRLGRIDQARVDQHLDVLNALDTFNSWPADLIDDDALVALMLKDKKSRGSLAFVLDGPNGLQLVEDVPHDAVIEVLRQFRCNNGST